MAEHDETRLFGIGFAVGATLGLVMGILYAPKPGREMRTELREKIVSAEHRAEHILAEARDKSKTIIEEARVRAASRKQTETSE